MSNKEQYFYDTVHLNIKGNIKVSENISNFFEKINYYLKQILINEK